MRYFNLKWLFTIVSFVVLQSLISQIPPYHWGHHMGGTSTDNAKTMVTDDSGNVYIAGDFTGTVDFDPSADTAIISEQKGIYLLKLNKYGEFQWVKQFSGSQYGFPFLEGKGITIDSTGALYLTGYFQDTVDFDPGPGSYDLIATGSTYDIFILKLTPQDGNFVWAKKIGDTFNDVGNSIITQNGYLYLTGYFRGIVDFDPGAGITNLTTVGNQDVFILKLDTGGNFVWARSVGSTTADEGNAIGIDSASNIYVTGYFQLTTDFDPGAGVFSLTSAGSWDIFVLKLLDDGSFSWAKRMGSSSFDAGNGLIIDKLGNVYTVGKFTDNVDFDPGAGITSFFGPGGDAFVQKLDGAGNFKWARKFGGLTATANPDEARSIHLDEYGDVYITGSFTSTCNFDFIGSPMVVVSNGMADGFLTKLDSLGNVQWVGNIGGISDDEASFVAINNDGNIYVCGRFNAGPVDLDMSAFGIDTVTSYGASDIFVEKLNQCFLSPSYPVDNTPLANLTYCFNDSTVLSASGQGIIYWYNSDTSATAIGVGNTFVTPLLAAGTYTFYAEDSICVSSDLRTAITVNVLSCLGIEEDSNLSILIYPNPTVDEVTISGIWVDSKLTITDMLGRTLFSYICNSETESIDTSGWAAGNYFITIQSSGYSVTRKIIKN